MPNLTLRHSGSVSTDLLVRWLATELCMRSHSVLEKVAVWKRGSVRYKLAVPPPNWRAQSSLGLNSTTPFDVAYVETHKAHCSLVIPFQFLRSIAVTDG
jgi:hypothetical protein